METTTRLIAGAMSGTSADGVDVALTRVRGRGLEMRAELVWHHHRPYEPLLKSAILEMRASGRTELRELARVGRLVSLTYAAAVTEALNGAGVKASELAAVAAHGQTLFHDAPLTIQYFDPSLVAYEVGCPVVSDFRRADCAAGGQGAPLVPFADYVLFRDETKNRVLLNIGGIANVTLLPRGVTPEKLVAFDTGPGNCVSDHICRTRRGGGPGYDEGGRAALRGKPDENVVRAVKEYGYFGRRPPKSTDGPEMIAAFEAGVKRAGRELSTEDLLASAARVTGETIVEAIRREMGGMPEEIIASGGGTENAAIMRVIAEAGGAGMAVRRTDEVGIKSEAKEALAFALLGAATLDGVAGNVPSVTGAGRGVVLGSVTPRP